MFPWTEVAESWSLRFQALLGQPGPRLLETFPPLMAPAALDPEAPFREPLQTDPP